MPATRPSARASVTCWARRPLRVLGVVCRTPEVDNSLTMLDTVAGDSPVAPASSTWVNPPCRFTASTIRARLASRSEVCDPGVARFVLTGSRYRCGHACAPPPSRNQGQRMLCAGRLSGVLLADHELGAARQGV